MAELKRTSALPEPEIMHLDHQGRISICVPPNGVAFLELM